MSLCLCLSDFLPQCPYIHYVCQKHPGVALPAPACQCAWQSCASPQGDLSLSIYRASRGCQRVVSPQRRLLLLETHSKAAESVVIYRNNSASYLLMDKCFSSAVESWKWITNSRITDLIKRGSGCRWYNCSNYSGGLAAVERCCPHKVRRACFN